MSEQEFVMEAYDFVTIGMRIAYMDCKGLLDLPSGLPGEEEIAAFAVDIRDGYHKYEWSWDDYIEREILKKYGKKEKEHD